MLDSALQEVVQRVLPLATRTILARDTDDAAQKRLPDVGKHDEYITYVVRDAQGRILVRSTRLPTLLGSRPISQQAFATGGALATTRKARSAARSS